MAAVGGSRSAAWTAGRTPSATTAKRENFRMNDSFSRECRRQAGAAGRLLPGEAGGRLAGSNACIVREPAQRCKRLLGQSVELFTLIETEPFLALLRGPSRAANQRYSSHRWAGKRQQCVR